MEIKLEKWFEYQRLVCPGCEGTDFHHYEVQVFSCGAGERGERVVVTADDIDTYNPSGKKFSVTMDLDTKDSPSRERQGMRILFWCEACDKHYALEIVQAKGPTTLELKHHTGRKVMID